MIQKYLKLGAKVRMIMHLQQPHPSSLQTTNYFLPIFFSSADLSTMANLRPGFSGNFGYSSDSTIRAQRTAQNYENSGYLGGGGIEFRSRTDGEDESGPPSPTLWKTSPTRVPEAEASLLNHRSLSPASRRHAIAKSRRELMEMIRNMPETSYELSLQDLVEQPYVQASASKNSNDSNSESEKAKRKKSQEMNKGRIGRSLSLETEPVMLKMFLPPSMRTVKKSFSMDRSSKVSPKATSLEAPEKGVDKEWWMKRYSFGGDSDSCVTSVNKSGSSGSSGSSSIESSSSRRRRRRRIGGLSGCWSCFQPKDKTL